jgi:2-polyprenyl-6-methoxyphenol hydroxylase-like FAD-dependent oxidoreductase
MVMKINIIGAGIGGLMTAISLQRKGYEVEIYEAAAELRPLGAGIIMASNALQIARRLGVAESIIQAGVPLQSFGIANHRGRPLQLMDIQAVKAKYGEPSVVIHRGNLQQILLKELASTSIQLGKRLASLEHLADGRVQARFENGSLTESDLLIGADGLRSATRRAIFGDTPLRYSSHTCWRGILPHVIDHPEQGLELWAKTGGKRIAMLQLSPTQVYFYYTEKRKPGFNVPVAERVAYLCEQLQEFPARYGQVMAKAKAEEIFHDDLYDLKPLPSWHQGRVVLIGDAAHATTPNMGQGGCQAVEDAWYLAEQLERYAEVEQAFQTFEALRRPKVEYVVRTSLMIGKLSNWGGALGYRLRNLLLSATPQAMADQQVERLYKLEGW